jgi:bla regulator protein blaR1
LQQTINHPQSRVRGWLIVILIALVGVLPYRVTATSAHNGMSDPPAAAAANVPPPLPPLPPPPPPPQPPLPPVPPVAPPPPPAPPVPRSTIGLSAHHIDIDIHSGARDGFALFDGDMITINGTDSDMDTAKRLRKGNDSMLWFRHGDKAYLIRDANYIQRARAAYAPVTELARQQGELGGRQGQLGGQQGALGARQGVLGAQQGQLASQQAMLAEQSIQHQRTAELETKKARLEAGEHALSQQQEELGQQQDALGKQQEVLGAQQEALGKRQQQVSEQANQQVRKLLDEAIANGVAQAVSTR